MYRKQIGEQSVTWLDKVNDDRAHDIVGVLVPFGKDQEPPFGLNGLPKVPMSAVEWLGVFEPPCDVCDVIVTAFGGDSVPPTYEYPILQSHIDTILKGALVHGEEFAAEWLDEIMWWETEPGVSYYLNDRDQVPWRG